MRKVCVVSSRWIGFAIPLRLPYGFGTPMHFRIGSPLLFFMSWWLAACGARLQAQPFTFSTLAGGTQGTNDGANGSAQFYFPSGIAVDHEGNLFVSDTSNNTIRKLTRSG